MELGGLRVDNVELREKTIVEIVVVLDGFTEVKNRGLGGGDWERHGGMIAHGVNDQWSSD